MTAFHTRRDGRQKSHESGPGRGKGGILTHCRGDLKVRQPLCKALRQFLKMPKHGTPASPRHSTPRFLPKSRGSARPRKNLLVEGHSGPIPNDPKGQHLQ